MILKIAQVFKIKLQIQLLFIASDKPSAAKKVSERPIKRD